MERWPHQIRAFDEITATIVGGGRRTCLASPTGGGKSFVICDLLEWANEMGWPAVLYTNRKMLTEQMIRTLHNHSIRFGVRAAGFADYENLDAPIQISSAQTEKARVLDSMKWLIHRAKLVIFDEAHLQKSETAQRLIELHANNDAAVVGFTATPVGVSHIYDKLIVAGTTSELRSCGALVPCTVYAPSEMDTRSLKTKQKTGEFSIGDIRKSVWTPAIFGEVMKHWKILNPSQRPTILFGPGVAESAWFAEQFQKAGVTAAHIDGDDVYVDGEVRGSDRDARDDVLRRFKSGDIKVLCNRFVLREGIDIPEIYHGILATPIGSVVSYVQIVGRILRASQSTPDVIIQDHGGNWWRHGSPNADRDWQSVWGVDEYRISERRAEALRNKTEQEPIVCPKCGAVRLKGAECYKCGHRHDKKVRMVIQKNGQLKPMVGDIFVQRKTIRKHDTARIWEQCYYRMKKCGRTFKQAEGLFFYENHYWPPHDLPFMPQNPLDWERRVKDVPREGLIQKEVSS